jgi:hypothetical protein
VVDSLDLNVRRVSQARVIDEASTLVLGGIDGTFAYTMRFKSKYDPIHAVQIDPYGKFITLKLTHKTALPSMPVWVKGMSLYSGQKTNRETERSILAVWSLQQVSFYHLPLVSKPLSSDPQNQHGKDYSYPSEINLKYSEKFD